MYATCSSCRVIGKTHEEVTVCSGCFQWYCMRCYDRHMWNYNSPWEWGCEELRRIREENERMSRKVLEYYREHRDEIEYKIKRRDEIFRKIGKKELSEDEIRFLFEE